MKNAGEKMGRKDIRDTLFQGVEHRIATARVWSEKKGVIAGIWRAVEKLKDMEIVVENHVDDGIPIKEGEIILQFRGPVNNLIKAEDRILGSLLKFSGIATASREAYKLANGRIKIVSGAWKKMPQEIKDSLRAAIQSGGVSIRICDSPFVYLDKNYVRIFGSITGALKAADVFPHHKKVIQLRGETGTIEEETREAVNGNASILMVDTGKIADVQGVLTYLEEMGIRGEKEVAFSGGILISEIPLYLDKGIDILDIGTQIIDAPLLDMKLDIVTGS